MSFASKNELNGDLRNNIQADLWPLHMYIHRHAYGPSLSLPLSFAHLPVYACTHTLPFGSDAQQEDKNHLLQHPPQTLLHEFKQHCFHSIYSWFDYILQTPHNELSQTMRQARDRASKGEQDMDVPLVHGLRLLKKKFCASVPCHSPCWDVPCPVRTRHSETIWSGMEPTLDN